MLYGAPERAQYFWVTNEGGVVAFFPRLIHYHDPATGEWRLIQKGDFFWTQFFPEAGPGNPLALIGARNAGMIFWSPARGWACTATCLRVED